LYEISMLRNAFKSVPTKKLFAPGIRRLNLSNKLVIMSSQPTFSTKAGKPRKPGVATDDEMESFIDTFGISNIVVVDARNPDFVVEPGDERWGPSSHAPIGGTETTRPRTVNLVYDRKNKSMPLEVLKSHIELVGGTDDWKETPIITHCGGGGRGQKSKVFLEDQGFKNVINGGGPSVTELWEKFGKI